MTSDDWEKRIDEASFWAEEALPEQRVVTVGACLALVREAFVAGKREAFETSIKIVEVRKAVQEGAALGAGDRRDWDGANYAEACVDEATTIIAVLRNRMQPDESLAKEPGDE